MQQQPTSNSDWLHTSIDAHEDKLMLAWTLVMAGLIGAVTVGFILVTENLGHRLHPGGTDAAWRRLMMPILGSAVAGFLLRRFFPNSAGSGIPQTKAALLLHDGNIPMRTAIGKFICSSITLASGVSLGREGPSVQVGAGIASSLGRRLGLHRSRISALVPAGAAAAVSAAFNTPIAAVLFTLEELVGNMHAPLLGSVVLSAATSWMVMRALLGDSPLFSVPPYHLVHPIELVFYALLGLAGGFVSAIFVKLLLWIRKRFAEFPAATKAIQPVAGGLMVGAFAWFIPEILGVGYSTVDEALNGKLLLHTMLMLLVLKVVVTAVCYGSGNAGGIFGPSLFIGGMVGGAVGSSAHYILPDLTGSVGAYALAGMGAAFAGIVRAPLTSVIMIFEITRDYAIIVPLMISNLISFFISQRLQHAPVYEALLVQDRVHLPSSHQILSPRTVGDAMRPVQRTGVTDQELLYPDESLDAAMRALALLPDGGEVPVVSRANASEIVGVISLEDVMADYRKGDDEQPAVPMRGKTLLAGIGIALILLLAGTTFHSYTSRRDRQERARESYRHGIELDRAGRHDEAIEALRNSLAVLRGDEQRLALARALIGAGRHNEAGVYLREILERNPSSAPANLWMARIETAERQSQEARQHYNRAIYGDWPVYAVTSRDDARWELSGTLAALGAQEGAVAELTQLLTENPENRALAMRIAQRFYELHQDERAVQVFGRLHREKPDDAAASAGYARALFASGDYDKAAGALAAAAEEAPGRADLARELALARQVLAHDPLLKGLRARERLTRSRALLEAVRTSARACKKMEEKAAGQLEQTDEILDEARRLWAARVVACPDVPKEEEYITLLMGSGRLSTVAADRRP